jgi:hypothetical protein
VSYRRCILTAVPLLLAGCWGVSGNGELERDTRDHRDFVSIDNHGELEVEVRQADDFRVTVSIDSNLLRNVKTRVRDDTLFIENNINLLDKVPGPHVLVEMPHLTYVRLNGSGDLNARGFDEDERVRFEMDGSADLTFDGSAPRIEATLEGSGDLRLSGTTDFLDIEAYGSGNVEARSLQAAGGKLRSDGSGDVTATVDGELDVDVSGAGDVDLYGEVDLRRRRDDGSGDIRVH